MGRLTAICIGAHVPNLQLLISSTGDDVVEFGMPMHREGRTRVCVDSLLPGIGLPQVPFFHHSRVEDGCQDIGLFRAKRIAPHCVGVAVQGQGGLGVTSLEVPDEDLAILGARGEQVRGNGVEANGVDGPLVARKGVFHAGSPVKVVQVDGARDGACSYVSAVLLVAEGEVTDGADFGSARWFHGKVCFEADVGVGHLEELQVSRRGDGNQVRGLPRAVAGQDLVGGLETGAFRYGVEPQQRRVRTGGYIREGVRCAGNVAAAAAASGAGGAAGAVAHEGVVVQEGDPGHVCTRSSARVCGVGRRRLLRRRVRGDGKPVEGGLGRRVGVCACAVAVVVAEAVGGVGGALYGPVLGRDVAGGGGGAASALAEVVEVHCCGRGVLWWCSGPEGRVCVADFPFHSG